MFNSNRRSISTFFLLLLIAAVSCINLGAQAPESRNLAWAQEFLRILYSNLWDHKYVMTARTSFPFDVPVQTMGHLDIQVGEMASGTIVGITAPSGVIGREPPKAGNLTPIYAKQFISANFSFEKAGHLSTFASEGTAVGKEGDYEHVKQLVGFHPEWKEAQDIEVLLKAGALYGPGEKDALLKTIPLEKLGRLFGKITVTSAEFETVTDDDQRFPLLHWLVNADIAFEDGTHSSYKLIFEPFKGALTNMDVVSP